jgi:hypothetical protein
MTETHCIREHRHFCLCPNSFHTINLSGEQHHNINELWREILRHVSTLGIPIDSGIDLSITIDKIRVLINKTLLTESLINQLLIRELTYQLLLIVGKLGQGMMLCKCTRHDLYDGGCQCQ